MSFWQDTALEDMTPNQWEALCDGCARCCLVKLEDEDTGEVHHTSVVCRYLDEQTCRCSDYPRRHELVAQCINFTSDLAHELQWLPRTCAYRRVAEGLDLEWWHPLVSGSAQSVHDAGISVRGKVVSEDAVHDSQLEDAIIHWVEV